MTIFEAAERGDVEAVRAFLEKGVDVNQVDEEGWNGRTALHVAACKAHLAVVNLLLEKGANIDVANNAGKTPLMIAKEKNGKEKFCLEIKKMLLEAKLKKKKSEPGLFKRLASLFSKDTKDLAAPEVFNNTQKPMVGSSGAAVTHAFSVSRESGSLEVEEDMQKKSSCQKTGPCIA